MIKIEPPYIKHRSCNCCHSQNEVKELLFSSEMAGIEVALCKECRKELLKKLKEEVDE